MAPPPAGLGAVGALVALFALLLLVDRVLARGRLPRRVECAQGAQGIQTRHGRFAWTEVEWLEQVQRHTGGEGDYINHVLMKVRNRTLPLTLEPRFPRRLVLEFPARSERA